jgi:hypothetical protein
VKSVEITLHTVDKNHHSDKLINRLLPLSEEVLADWFFLLDNDDKNHEYWCQKP